MSIRERGLSPPVSVSKALASLGSYAANDVLSESTATGTSWAFTGISRGVATGGYIVKAMIRADTTGKVFRPTMFLFDAPPAGGQLNDNALNIEVSATDAAKYIGKIDWVATETLNSGYSESIATPSTIGNLAMSFQCANDSDDLFGVLVSRNAIALGTGGTVTVSLTVERL